MTHQLPDLHPHNHHSHQQQRRAVDLRIPAIEKYAYCLCLHVKPTTIFIAVFKLIRALLFASILLNTEFSNEQAINDLNLASIDDRHRSTAAAVSILTRIIMASVSAVAIYAVISGRAALLMPLYAMLLVDFFFALPAFYNRELDPSFSDSVTDFKNYSNGSNQYTRYSLILFATITMIVKIYFLCVIWKCYRVLGSGDLNDLTSGHNIAPPPYESISSNMKPPNYEEAMKTSSLVTPVHSANSATSQQQQTAVFTDPSSEQRQNVSTQLIQGTVNVNTSQPPPSSNLEFVANNLTGCNNTDDHNTTSQVFLNSVDPQTHDLNSEPGIATENVQSNEVAVTLTNDTSVNIPKQNEK